MERNNHGASDPGPELDVAAALADISETDLAQRANDVRSEDDRKPVGSRSDLDRGDDRRLVQIGRGRILEVQLERLPQIRERLLHRLAVAGDLDIEATRHIPGRLMGNCGREARGRILDTRHGRLREPQGVGLAARRGCELSRWPPPSVDRYEPPILVRGSGAVLPAANR